MVPYFRLPAPRINGACSTDLKLKRRNPTHGAIVGIGVGLVIGNATLDGELHMLKEAI